MFSLNYSRPSSYLSLTLTRQKLADIANKTKHEIIIHIQILVQSELLFVMFVEEDFYAISAIFHPYNDF